MKDSHDYLYPAVFLDRDGTINEEMGYINHPDRFIIFPFAAEAVRIFNQMGLKVVVITNQSGVARGYYTENLVATVHDMLHDHMKKENAIIDGVYYCPHHPTEGKGIYRRKCNCRKPAPGMLLRAANDLDLDLSRSIMIGDRYKDVEFAAVQKLKTAMVMTGYGRGEYTNHRHLWKYQPDWIGETVLDAAQKIRNYHTDSEKKQQDKAR